MPDKPNSKIKPKSKKRSTTPPPKKESTTSTEKLKPTLEPLNLGEATRKSCKPTYPFNGTSSLNLQPSHLPNIFASGEVDKLFVEIKRDPNVRKDLIVNPFSLLQNSDILPSVPRPKLPQLSNSKWSMYDRMEKIQEFINKFEYNYVEQYFFDISRQRPLFSIMETCREIIRECLPIRCVEGTFLALYCTQSMEEVDRFSVFFKTCMKQRIYRHIVCCVKYKNRFGVLGISRKSDLMYKPLEYNSLSEILNEFVNCYLRYGHVVQSIKISLPIPHQISCKETPHWNYLNLDLTTTEWQDISITVDKFIQDSPKILQNLRKKKRSSP
ncbi:hypothetical protein ABK040_002932 [Willaertia magna]